MIKSEKKLTELKKILDSGHHAEIERIISNLRDFEPFEGAIKLLACFFDASEDERLKQSISQFFNDMKENSARGEVIDALETVSHNEAKAMLVSSCWQSGLDYSEYAAKLAEIYLKGDYNTSLECFTVFDTCSMSIPEPDKILIVNRLKEANKSFDPPKKLLTKELISILQGSN